MDASKGAAARMYEDFVPSSEFVQEEDCDTLLLYLPGFNKEQLRVQLTRGILSISGSRPLGHNKWSRFQKEFPVSANCDINQMTARFEGGILYVKQPKMITPADKQDQKLPASKASESEKPGDDQPQPQKNFQDQSSKRTSHTDGPTKKTDSNNVPEKAQEKLEQKTTNRKSNGSADVKNGKETRDEKKTSLPEISSEEKESSNKDKEKKTSDEPMTDSINASEKKEKATTGSDKTYLASYGEIARGMAARLKLPGQMMNVVLAVLLALVLDLYISNFISRKAEN